jgi:hypothetical protein
LLLADIHASLERAADVLSRVNRPFRDGHHIGRPKQGLPKRRPPLGDYRRVQP